MNNYSDKLQTWIYIHKFCLLLIWDFVYLEYPVNNTRKKQDKNY